MADYCKVKGSFQKCYETLNSKGFIIPDAKPFAGLRVSDAREKGSWVGSEICVEGAWMANGIVYDGKNVLVTDGAHNPIMKNIRKAIRAHSEDREFTLDNKTIEELRDLSKKHPEDAIKTGVLLLTDRENLPVKQLSNRQYGQFLFQQDAEPYGGLCQEAGINVIPVYFVSAGKAKKIGKPFSRTLWIHDILFYGRSGLSGLGSVVIDFDSRAFGIPSKEGIEARVTAK